MVRETLTTYSGVMPERHGSGTTLASALALALLGGIVRRRLRRTSAGLRDDRVVRDQPQGHDHR